MYKSAKPNILVTGAAGFLGSKIVRQLCDATCRLRTTTRSKSGSALLPHCQIADLTNPDDVADLVQGVDVVIHTAGITHGYGVAKHCDEEYFRVNTFGTESLVRSAAAAGCRRFILVSSVSVYGHRNPPFVESAQCFPANAYARSKLEAERIVAEVAESARIDWAILRMAPICGEGARGNVDRLMKAIDRRRFIWVGSGANQKSLVHVEDAASTCVTVARCNRFAGSGVFNISTSPIPMREIVSALAQALGRNISPVSIPAQVPLRLVGGAARLPLVDKIANRAYQTLDKWLCDEVYSNDLFCQSFDWRPHIDIHEALARQVSHYRNSFSRCA